MLSTHFVQSQPTVIEGKVLAADGHPIAYANVYLSSSKQYGTVTNIEGHFSIRATRGDTLNVSHIGFISRAFPISGLLPGKASIIVLEELATELGEVIITPRDSLRILLATAYTRIEENYPSGGTLITGFYREANQVRSDNSFLYFAESIIQFYKPSYANKQYGPVKLLEGGKSELANRHNISKVDFYGGLYIAQNCDFVKQRLEFIHPDHYNKYDYLILPTALPQGTPGYKVQFTPRAGAHFKGEFYLEKESLAYAGASYQYSDFGIRRHNLKNIGPFAFTSKRITVQYSKIENKWNVFLVFAEGIGSLDTEIRVTSEYVSTRFESVETNPIGESEAIPASGVYMYQTKAFADDFWQNRGTILRTNALDSTISLLLKQEELTLKTSGTARQGTSRRTQPQWHKHLALLSTSLFLGVVPVDVTAGTIAVDYGNAFSIQKNVAGRTRIPTLGYELRYTTPQRLSYTISYSTNLSKEFSGIYVALGTEWSKTIAGWKKALTVQPGLALFYSDLYQDLGVTTANTGFQFGSSYIPQGSIRVYAGEQRTGISPSLAIGFRFRSRLAAYAKCSFPMALANREIIAVTHDPAPLIGKGRMSPAADELSVTIEGEPTSSSGTMYRNFLPVPWFGIRFGF